LFFDRGRGEGVGDMTVDSERYGFGSPQLCGFGERWAL